MAENSAQLSSLLLPAGLVPVQMDRIAEPGPGLRDPEAPAGSQRDGIGDFHADLQAMLAGGEAAPVPPPIAARQPQPAADPRALAGLQTLQDSLPAADAALRSPGGKQLPESGSVLPLPLVAPAGSRSVADPASWPSIPVAGQPLQAPSNGVRAGAVPVAGHAGQSPLSAAELPARGASEGVGSELPAAPVAAHGAGYPAVASAGVGTVVAHPAAGLVAPLVADAQNPVARPGFGRDGSDGRLSARQQPAAEFMFRSLTGKGAHSESATRVGALAESSLAQFNLHAQSEVSNSSLLSGAHQLPGSAAAEAVGRDLANLTPLRPHTGEGLQQWSAGLGQRLLMMAENGVESARLRLHPANLGPLDIHVSVDDDRAHVWFGAQHSATRDALEAALPRLREMFAEQGLQLAQADVGQRQAGGGRPGEEKVRADGLVGITDARTLSDAGAADKIGAHAWAGSDSRALDIYV